MSFNDHRITQRNQKRLFTTVSQANPHSSIPEDSPRERLTPLPVIASANEPIADRASGQFQLMTGTPDALTAGTKTRTAWNLTGDRVDVGDVVQLVWTTAEDSRGFWVTTVGRPGKGFLVKGTALENIAEGETGDITTLASGGTTFTGHWTWATDGVDVATGDQLWLQPFAGAIPPSGVVTDWDIVIRGTLATTTTTCTACTGSTLGNLECRLSRNPPVGPGLVRFTPYWTDARLKALNQIMVGSEGSGAGIIHSLGQRGVCNRFVEYDLDEATFGSDVKVKLDAQFRENPSTSVVDLFVQMDVTQGQGAAAFSIGFTDWAVNGIGTAPIDCTTQRTCAPGTNTSFVPDMVKCEVSEQF